MTGIAISILPSFIEHKSDKAFGRYLLLIDLKNTESAIAFRFLSFLSYILIQHTT